MPRAKSRYRCQSCGDVSLKWQGQCDGCGAWNTLLEEIVAAGLKGQAAPGRGLVRLEDVMDDGPEARQSTGIGELDRVLGGGLVDGSVALIGGDPGIGKSTLLLTAAARLADQAPVLYVTGEESLAQVSLRARRLELEAGQLGLLAETSIEKVLAAVKDTKPDVLIVDSIQTVYSEELQSAPGSVTQLRECAAALVRIAKSAGISVFIVGHVTKEGTIAGPRVLEHMVDTVLYFESDTGSRFRIVRAVKNRFGAANEIGVFAMTGSGLKEVRNPSAIFLAGREREVPGSSVTIVREGSRPLLLEVQALVDDSQFSQPRRLAVGLDPNRLSLLLAVLHRHGGMQLSGMDVFANVVGGMRVNETSADLSILLAVVSSFRGNATMQDLVAFGEIGLGGELRPVPYGEERIQQAVKHGFRRAIVPKANRPKQPIDNIEVIAVESLGDALEAAFTETTVPA